MAVQGNHEKPIREGFFSNYCQALEEPFKGDGDSATLGLRQAGTASREAQAGGRVASTGWGVGSAGLTPTSSERFLETNIRPVCSARICFGAMVVGTISECSGKQNCAVSPTWGQHSSMSCWKERGRSEVAWEARRQETAPLTSGGGEERKVKEGRRVWLAPPRRSGTENSGKSKMLHHPKSSSIWPWKTSWDSQQQAPRRIVFLVVHI